MVLPAGESLEEVPLEEEAPWGAAQPEAEVLPGEALLEEVLPGEVLPGEVLLWGEAALG